MNGKDREVELDLLRIMAMVAVVFVHASGMKTNNDFEQQIMTIIKGIVTWEIPCFVMISGRFFLDPSREVSARKVSKSIVRLAIAFAFWSIIYQVYYIVSGIYGGLNWKGIISQYLQGPYHFWYIYMLCGLYLLVPFLRLIVKDKKLTEYFLVLFLIFEFLVNYGAFIPFIGGPITVIMGCMNFNFALGYVGYFVAGYYFSRYKVSDKMECILYCFGIVMWMGAAILLIRYNDFCFVQYLTPNVAVESFALYTFFVKRVSKFKFNQIIRVVITKVSEYSFGIYLIHALVLEMLGVIGFSSILSPVIMVSIDVVTTVLISGIIVHIIRMIPAIGKKIT